MKSGRLDNRGRWLLVCGAAVGVVVAAKGLVERKPDRSEIPADAVAVVNGVAISQVDYQRALAAIAAGREDGIIDESARRYVLDRLIEEELLVQRGLELRLAERDPLARTYISAAVINLVVARGEDDVSEPSDDELQAFYRDNRDYFRAAERLEVAQIYFRSGAGGHPAARQRATAARQRLAAGESFEAVAASGDPPSVDLPATFLTVSKLRDYLGPGLTRSIRALEPGEISQPLESTTGYHLVQLIARQQSSTPVFAQIRPQVVAEFRRRAGDRRVRELIEERRSAAEIAIARERL